jgi:hypothetical protein
MRARATFLAALAIAVAASTGLSIRAEAQPFGRALGQRVAERGQERRESRREERRGEGRGEGRGNGRGEGRGEPRGDYRPPAYVPAPSAPAYAYPAPAYPYDPRGAQPPAYVAPRAQEPGRNSLGAYWGQQQDAARRGVREGRLLQLGQVTDNIRRNVPGRMLDAGLEPGPDGRPAYRVRWAAAGGRRIDFIVDAATGAIIGQSGY